MYKLGDTVQIRHPKPFEPYRGDDAEEMLRHAAKAIVDGIEEVLLDTPEKVDAFNGGQCTCGFQYREDLRGGMVRLTLKMAPANLYWNCPFLAQHQRLLEQGYA